MSEEKFAFELDKVSIAMAIPAGGLGDTLVPRKILNALVELEPRCSVDIFCNNTGNLAFVSAFYSDSQNVNLIRQSFSKELTQKYDLLLKTAGTFVISAETSDKERLKAKSPALFNSFVKINAYNEKFVKPFQSSYSSYALHNYEMARVLGKNIWYFLSCAGALPIRDNVEPYIALSPGFKSRFDDLKLDKYITIYSNVRNVNNSKLKAWSIEYLVEFVDLMKKNFPQIKIIQCGGGILKLRMLTATFSTWTWNLLSTFWRTASCMSVARAA